MRKARALRWGAGVALVVCAGLLALAYYYVSSRPRGAPPTNFQECAARWGATGGFPRTCAVPFTGPAFVEYEGNDAQLWEQIRITNLPPAPSPHSPLVIEGEAKGSWFAAGPLTIRLYAGQGDVIAQAQASGTASSMEGLAPFSATLDFSPPPPGTQGAIVVESSDGRALVLPVVY